MNTMTSSSFGIVLEHGESEAIPVHKTESRYGIATLAAIGVHAAFLMLWQNQPELHPPEYGVDFAKSSVEVTLVAALQAESHEAILEVPDVPNEVVSPPEINTPSVPIEAPEAASVPLEPAEPVFEKMSVAVSEPVPSHVAVAASKPAPQPPAKHLQSSRHKAVAKVSGDGSSAKPGTDVSTMVQSAGAPSAMPGYLRNPQPAYPEASQRAGEQGQVILRVNVDDKGAVIAVAVARSSGFTRLDERAQSTVLTQWRFKPAQEAGKSVASQLRIPISFTLQR